MTSTDLRRIVLPNPALTGGELLLAGMASAKQTVYAEQRRRHIDAWRDAERAHTKRMIAHQMSIIMWIHNRSIAV